MLLEASDAAMYEKMDRREKSRIIFGMSLAAAFAALLLWGFAVVDGLGIYYTLISLMAAAISFYEYRKLKREIMPLAGCFISLQAEYLSVCQPKGSGKYEACEIYYQEVEKVIAGRRSGIPSFFVILRESAQYSSIIDPDTSGRTIFCVNGEHYDKKLFVNMFVGFCGKLPERAAFINMDSRSRWKREKMDGYDLFLYMLPTFYILPVVIKILYY